MSTMDKQIELEYRMLQSGINRYNKQLEDMVASNLQSKTLHGRSIISGVLNVARLVGVNVETQLRLDEWLKQDKGTATNLIRMANKKSDKGFDHKRHGLNHKMKADNVDIPYWSDTDRIHVGLRLIDVIIKDTGIIKLRSEYTRRKTITYLQATDDTLEWIKAFNETHESNLPRHSPCIIPPKDWDSFFGGGYYSEHINKKPFLRIHGI